MTSDVESLRAILTEEIFHTGLWGVPEVRAWLMAATEDQRSAANELVQNLLATYHNGHQYVALHLAAAGTAGDARGTVDALANHRAWSADALADSLAGRGTVWLREFAELWNDEDPQNARATIDLLVKAGLIERPRTPGYQRAMLSPLVGRPSAERIRDRLLTVPETAGQDVLELLSFAEVGCSLYMHDFYYRRQDAEATWVRQIARVVDEGVVPRQPAIDLCATIILGEPERRELIWFIALHEALRPTASELQAHLPEFVRALGAAQSTVISVAQSAISDALAAGLVDDRDIIDASGAPLARREKKVVLAQLRLLTSMAQRHPTLREEVVTRAREALDHERTDVQAAALKLIAKFAGPEQRAAIAGDDVSSVLAAEIADAGLIGGTREDVVVDLAAVQECVRALPEASAARQWAAAGLESARNGIVPDAPRVALSMGAVLPPPIDDPYQLVTLFTQLIERNGRPIEVQRLLAAAVRTATIPLSERAELMSPILERAREQAVRRADTAGGYHTWGYVAALALSWATGWHLRYGWWSYAADSWQESREEQPPTRMSGVFAVQVAEATRAIAHAPGLRLLAEPTHDSGAVAPAALLERLRANGRDCEYSAIDLDLAALHLPVALDDHFWETARSLHETATEHLVERYRALTDTAVQAVVGVPGGEFYNRREQGQLVVLAQTEPVRSTPGVWSVMTDLQDILERYGDIVGRSGFAEFDSRVAMWPTIAPWHHELTAAHLLMPLSRGLQPGNSAAPTAAAALDSSTGAFGPIAHLALLVALQGAEAETRTVAADLWHATATDGRLDPMKAVIAITTLAGSGALKLGRVIDAIRPTIHDAVVGYRTLQIFSGALPELIRLTVRELHQLVELLTELAMRFGTQTIPDEVRTIAARRSSSALVVAARRLAAAVSDGPETALAAAEAVRGFVTRVLSSERLPH